MCIDTISLSLSLEARDVRHLPFNEQLDLLHQLGPNLSQDVVSQVLSFAHTMLTEESSNLGLPDFPVENLPPLVSMLNNVPQMSVMDALLRLYPYKSFLPEEGCQSVEDTVANFSIPRDEGKQVLAVDSVLASSEHPGRAQVTVSVNGRQSGPIEVPAGPHPSVADSGEFVATPYHDMFLAEVMLSHSVKDFCIIGPKGCGKSVVLQRLADLLGYEVEPIMLYQDMTARDLLQQRTTTETGDTVWR